MTLNAFVQSYIKAENFITNFLMLSVVFFVFIAAVMRWAGSPIAWSVEIAQLLFVWLIFLGANRSLRENRHIGVDFFVKKLPSKIRNVLDILIYLLILAFLLFVSRFGILLSIENYVRQLSSLSISYAYISASVPIGCFIMSITTIGKIWEKISTLGSPKH
ncbi:TRAP-type C4-dicarboxylate transport system, small permease component [Salinibacillus kushneri]|uniref:TRAP-type C4-dicarboxylate transport system, small permease component n=1 Tax=Salinibacillus kushneri TaxID=237682 RepID=A0A1I0C950_9BACI|nr:TRAP-type C4-dicarboxylate transport system, small permease component [Salinibacillus kushneri]